MTYTLYMNAKHT